MSKLYTITSNYSQGSQAQIQGIHSSDELFLRYEQEYKNTVLGTIFFNWLDKDKTRVDLKINKPSDIEKLAELFQTYSDELSIPFAVFQEPELRFTTTAISFVAPDVLCHPIQYAIRDLFFELKKCKNKDDKINSFLDNFSIAGVLNTLKFNTNGCTILISSLSNTVTVEYDDVSIQLTPAQLEFYRVVRHLSLA